jgi:hypothetical protein
VFKDYKNKFNGDRCFIIGSGSSLKKEKLQYLKNEHIFVVNRSYKALEIGLPHFDFYVCVDTKVYNDHSAEIQKCSKFPRFYSQTFLESKKYWDGPREKFIPVYKHASRKEKKFDAFYKGEMPLEYEIGWGKTVTVVVDAILIAYFMGFKKIYLLGVDMCVPNISDTHFYGDEKRLRGILKKINQPHFFSLSGIQIIKNLIAFSNYLNFEIVNLSQGNIRSDLFKTDSLEKLINKS